MSEDKASTIVVSKATGEHYTWGNRCDGWHLVKHVDLSVIHERMPPGTAEVRHYHQSARQFFFVLSGNVTLEVAGTRKMVGVHQGVEVPPGVPHQIFNESDQPVEFLVISQPTSRGDRINIDHDRQGD